MAGNILIISGAMISRLPHVEMYINILKQHGVDYDVVVWNRRRDDISTLPENYCVYNHGTNDDYPPIRKLWEIYKFYRFVKNKIEYKAYKSIIIFEIADSIFFQNYLRNNYNKRYILDIRDYSPLLKVHLTRILLKSLIKHSYCTVISSLGFQYWLPCKHSYVLSHNIDKLVFQQLMNSTVANLNINRIRVLTIGNLRDANMNCKVASALANNNNYYMDFVGDGAARPIIEEYCERNSIHNVSFFGHYEKKDEVNFYRNADIINCCMEDNMLSNYLMSNRIYLAALLGKPILCIYGSYQSSIVEHYHLGCVVRKNENLLEALKKYVFNFKIKDYADGRESFLSLVRNDQIFFEKMVLSLVK